MLMLLVLSQVSFERHQKFKEYLEGKSKQQQCGMWVCFFNHIGIVYWEFLEQAQTVNEHRIR
jgi:hypothetical protein